MLPASTLLRLPFAAQALRDGGIVAYPTEAVWGLGCDPHNKCAVLRLLELKRRNWRKGLILVAASMAQLQPYLHGLTSRQMQTLHSSWPGPHTWLVPNNGVAPDWVTGGQETLALRVSAHPVVVALCKKFGTPIVSTSANRAGKLPARNVLTLRRYFGSRLNYVLPGVLGSMQNPTVIRDLMSGNIIRPS